MNRFKTIALAALATAVVGFCGSTAIQAQDAPKGDAGNGKRIYLADGCFTCHGAGINVLTGTIGNGGPSVKVETSDGDVTISKSSVAPLPPTPPVAPRISIKPVPPPHIMMPKVPKVPAPPKPPAAPANPDA